MSGQIWSYNKYRQISSAVRKGEILCDSTEDLRKIVNWIMSAYLRPNKPTDLSWGLN